MAGRPLNSKTPLCRNLPALKVRAYRLLKEDEATRKDCAKVTGISRTTAIKWWDEMKWTEEKKTVYEKVSFWNICKQGEMNYEECAMNLGITIDQVKIEYSTQLEVIKILKK